MNKFYIYKFLRENLSPDGEVGTPYYIGKGQGKRAYMSWRTIPRPKNEEFIEIVCKDLMEVEAFQIEILLIYLYGRIDIGTGCLRNLTDGGEGAIGYRATKETRALLSSQRIGNQYRRGIPHTEETKRNMSISRTGNKITPEICEKIRAKNLGRIFTPEHRAKLSLALRGKGRPHTEESRRKIAVAHTGKVHSEEHKRRQREGRLAGKARRAISSSPYQLDLNL